MKLKKKVRTVNPERFDTMVAFRCNQLDLINLECIRRHYPNWNNAQILRGCLATVADIVAKTKKK